jgi:hypothetical protein
MAQQPQGGDPTKLDPTTMDTWGTDLPPTEALAGQRRSQEYFDRGMQALQDPRMALSKGFEAAGQYRDQAYQSLGQGKTGRSLQGEKQMVQASELASQRVQAENSAKIATLGLQGVQQFADQVGADRDAMMSLYGEAMAIAEQMGITKHPDFANRMRVALEAMQAEFRKTGDTQQAMYVFNQNLQLPKGASKGGLWGKTKDWLGI